MHPPNPVRTRPAGGHSARILLASVLGTTASVFPAFLTAAVAVQLAAEIGLDEAQLGRAIGLSFGSAALWSAVLGRVAERVGAVTAMRLGLGLTAATGIAIVGLVDDPTTLTAALVVAGACNALTQPAANLLLSTLPTARLGTAFAVKQAGMPGATMLGGLTVPAVALTVGWRGAYLVGVVLVALALLTLPGDRLRMPTRPPGADTRPDLPLRLLVVYAAVGCLGAASAGAMVTFLVTGAERSGVPPGPAALLLTAGSLLGIASRLVHGRLADRGRLTPLRRTGVLLALGTIGLLLFALDQPTGYVLGVPAAFGAGWAWPGLFNLSVVRWNPSAPASATGVTQTGVYIGAGGGPLVGGVLVDRLGYASFWLISAATLAAAAAVAYLLRRALVARRGATVPATVG